ncbi:MAG: alpha/beta hydrolase [Dehalococcoidia bacterium]|nr:alpha/beta hydrolase [Dehalococcoidia bacterium]
MGSITAVDEHTGRKFYLDDPDDLEPDEQVVFLLSLHGGGSVGHWQRLYFPAVDFKERYRLVVATPSAATKEPSRRWVGEADDEHLRNIVEYVFGRYGVDRIRSFWLVGHSQGGMTSNRLLNTDYFAQRVDGWLSLSGGRIGPVDLPESFFAPVRVGMPQPERGSGPRPGRAAEVDADISFIFATGEHEIVALPQTSPWAEKYGAGPRERRPDVTDEEPGQIYDSSREGRSTPAWGLIPRPGTAEVYVYPNARGGHVIADVVRLDKGHTEGLEPNVTRTLLEMVTSAPGGKARTLLSG